MKKRNGICIILAMFLAVFMLTACSSNNTTSVSVSDETSVESKETEEIPENEDNTDTTNTNELPALEGKTLFVYCGAGMTKPFTEIVEDFQNETGAKVEVTFANAAQIISQIKASKEGDLFIAGDEGELSTIQDDYVTDTKSLVKHIPVIAVQSGNPKNIKSLADFANDDVVVVLGDNKATPIGKIADKALSDAGILSSVTIISRTTTAPEIATALSLGQCDTSIIWKENANIEGVEVVESKDMEPYVKTVPAASLKCSTNDEVLEAFLLYLNTDTVKNIWISYGYELQN